MVSPCSGARVGSSQAQPRSDGWKGSVSGKIFYGNIQINEGGKLIGEIEFRDKNNKQEEFKDWKSL